MGRRNNVHEIVQGLDACVVPSLKEPLGLCALEAMAAGVPVAAARVGGLKEFVIPEETGLLFNPKVPAEIASSVARLISEPSLRETVIQNSRDMLEHKFSPTAITSRIENALQTVVANNRNRLEARTFGESVNSCAERNQLRMRSDNL